MADSMWLTEEQKRRRLWAIIIGVFVIGIILLITIPDWGSEEVSEEINITQVAAQNEEMKNELEDIKETLESTLQKSKEDEEWQELDISEENFAENKEAAESCPVNVIHIVNKKTGEKLI